MRNKKQYIQDFDELNTLVNEADLSEVEETIETSLVLAAKRGIEDTEDDLDFLLDTGMIGDFLAKTISKVIDGKTWNERVRECILDGDARGINKIAETEYHRVYNEASMMVAKAYQKVTERPVTKTWITVNDDKVRGTHELLGGLTKALDEPFYTYDGDSALYPSNFKKASNNINCRCYLKYR